MRHFIFFILIILPIYIIAQNNYSSTVCTLSNSKGEAISNAVVEVLHTPVIAMTNEKGIFNFDKLPLSYCNDTVKVSHLAYRDTLLLVRELLETPTVTMQEQLYTLNEIIMRPNQIVSDLSALQVVKQAIERIPENYSDSIYTKMGHFVYLALEEITQDTIVHTSGFSNILLPQLIHNIQKYPDQEKAVSKLYDRREEFVSSFITGGEINPRVFIPYFCDFRLVDYYMNYGVIGNNLPFNGNNLKGYHFFIADTIVIENREYVKISFTPKEEASFTFNGELIIDTESYLIKTIKLRIIRHTENIYRQHAISIGGKNENLFMPIYDFYTYLSFSDGTDSEKSYLENAIIEATFNIHNRTKEVDSDRVSISYKISNFAEKSTSVRKLHQGSPNVLQKRLIKIIEKQEKEVLDYLKQACE